MGAKRPGGSGETEDSPIIGGRILLDVGEPELKDFSSEIDEILFSLKIDPNDIDNEMADHASTFARIAILSEEAAHQARWAKRAVEIGKADLNYKLRKEYAQAEGRKPTDDAIKAEVEADDEIGDLIDDQLKAERTQGILKQLAQAVRDRRDMLMEMARNQRHEWQASGGD